MFSIESISFSVQGRRKSNEDSLIVDDDNSIYVVCDGIGGYSDGKLASETAAKAFHTIAKQNAESNLDIESLSLQIENQLNLVSQETIGTTLVGFRVTNDEIVCNYLGDSKAVVVFKDASLWVSKDHSLVQELLDADVITELQARVHPKKNVITKCFATNGRPTDVLSQYSFPIRNVDRIYLFSDGILDLYNIASLVDSPMDSKQLTKMEKLCTTMAKDNCTFICCKINQQIIN